MTTLSCLLLCSVSLIQIKGSVAVSKDENAKRAAEAQKASAIFAVYADCLSDAAYIYMPDGPTTDAKIKANRKARADNFKALEAFYSRAPEITKTPKLDKNLKAKFEDCLVKKADQILELEINKDKIEGLLRLKHTSSSFESVTQPEYSNQGAFKQEFEEQWAMLIANDKYLQKLVPKLDEAFPPSTDQCWNGIDTHAVQKSICDPSVMNLEIVQPLFNCIANKMAASSSGKRVEPKEVRKISKIIKWGLDFMFCDKYRLGRIGLHPSKSSEFLVEQNILSMGGVVGKIWKGLFLTYALFAFGGYKLTEEKMDNNGWNDGIIPGVSIVGGVIAGIVSASVFGSIFGAVQLIGWVFTTLFYAAPKLLIQFVAKCVEEL